MTMRIRLIGMLLALAVPALCAAEEFVYEGRPAAEWVKDLAAGKNPDKAKHALGRLGADAIPALVQLLQAPEANTRELAAAALQQMKLDPKDMGEVLPLLKHADFEVRRTAVRLLGRFAAEDKQIAVALKELNQDRDKAVVEAVEQAFMAAKQMFPGDAEEYEVQRAKYDAFLNMARKAADGGDIQTALDWLHDAEKMPVHRFLPKELAVASVKTREMIEHAERKMEGRRFVDAKGREEDRRRMEEMERRKFDAKRREGERLFDKEMPDKRRDFIPGEKREKGEPDLFNDGTRDKLLARANALIEDGRVEDAMNTLGQLRKMAPDDPRLMEALKRVQERVREMKEGRDGKDGDGKEGGDGKKVKSVRPPAPPKEKVDEQF